MKAMNKLRSLEIMRPIMAKNNSALTSRMSAVGLALVLSGVMALAAMNPPATDTAATLLRLHEDLDQQTQRIDRLYAALGPELDELEKRATENDVLIIAKAPK